jgi:hypothetical protein
LQHCSTSPGIRSSIARQPDGDISLVPRKKPEGEVATSTSAGIIVENTLMMHPRTASGGTATDHN